MSNPAIQNQQGGLLNVQDYVRYLNPTAGSYPAFYVAVVTSTSANGTFAATALNKDGTTTALTGLIGTQALQFDQAGAPGNGASSAVVS